jgi:hypothetical protein
MYTVGEERKNYINNMVTTLTDNLSYLILQRCIDGDGDNVFESLIPYFVTQGDSGDIIGKTSVAEVASLLDLGSINQDYEFMDNGEVKTEASRFHVLRRETIIKTIQEGLNKAFNEYNLYADVAGVTYDFHLPEIGMDEWNNTIDDISVLSFVQGIPLGYDIYYNNYSFGGARIVKAHNYYAEQVTDAAIGGTHNVYHQWFCKLIPRNEDGSIAYEGDGKARATSQPDYPTTRTSSGIRMEYITSQEARKDGYYACSKCM